MSLKILVVLVAPSGHGDSRGSARLRPTPSVWRLVGVAPTDEHRNKQTLQRRIGLLKTDQRSKQQGRRSTMREMTRHHDDRDILKCYGVPKAKGPSQHPSDREFILLELLLPFHHGIGDKLVVWGDCTISDGVILVMRQIPLLPQRSEDPIPDFTTLPFCPPHFGRLIG